MIWASGLDIISIASSSIFGPCILSVSIFSEAYENAGKAKMINNSNKISRQFFVFFNVVFVSLLPVSE